VEKVICLLVEVEEGTKVRVYIAIEPTDERDDEKKKNSSDEQA
jgi:hypothetical protein